MENKKIIREIGRQSFITKDKNNRLWLELEISRLSTPFVRHYEYIADRDKFISSEVELDIVYISGGGNGTVTTDLVDGFYKIKTIGTSRSDYFYNIKVKNGDYEELDEYDFKELITTETDRKYEQMKLESYERYEKEQEEKFAEALKDLGKVEFLNNEFRFTTQYHPKFKKAMNNKKARWNATDKVWILTDCVDAYRIAKRFKLKLENENMFNRALKIIQEEKELKQEQKDEEQKKIDKIQAEKDEEKAIKEHIANNRWNEAFTLLTQEKEIKGEYQTYLYQIFSKTSERKIIDFALGRYKNDLAALLDNENINDIDVEFIKSNADLTKIESAITKKLIEKKLI